MSSERTTTSSGLSLRAYAKLRKARGMDGGSPAAVHKAVATGRIKRNRHGKIDPDQADRDWSANTATVARREAPPPPAPASAKPPAPRKTDGRRDQVGADVVEHGSDEDGEVDFNYHRARNERAKANRSELELAIRAEKLVNADDSVRAFADQIAAAKSILRSRSRTIVEELCRVGGVPKAKMAAVSDVLARSDESILKELSGVEYRDPDTAT